MYISIYRLKYNFNFESHLSAKVYAFKFKCIQFIFINITLTRLDFFENAQTSKKQSNFNMCESNHVINLQE